MFLAPDISLLRGAPLRNIRSVIAAVFVERRDLFVHLGRKIEIPIDVAGRLIIRILANGKVLLRHPFENAFPLRRIVSTRFNLLD